VKISEIFKARFDEIPAETILGVDQKRHGL